MGLLGKAKLQKVTFKAYKARGRSRTDYIDELEVMYNPESFSQTYAIEYDGALQSINSSKKAVKYQRSKPGKLNLKLIIDGTGVESIGLAQLFSPKTTAQRVKDFIDLTFRMNGRIHEPNFLVVQWGGKEDGGLIFSCRLASVTVNYTAFNRDGSPLRAELEVELVSDLDDLKRLRQENKSSPDLTHTRVVKSGDTLPLLCTEIYGSPKYYLQVAAVNQLDNFRDLTPGQTLIFPPLGS